MDYSRGYNVAYGPESKSTSEHSVGDFTTVPGMDYTDTGIKGNLEQSFESEHNKTQAMFDADSPYDMAMAFTGNLENVGDALDPGAPLVRGMVDITKAGLRGLGEFSKERIGGVVHSIKQDPTNWKNFRGLPQHDKQSVVNAMFNSRDMSAKGMIPEQTIDEVAERGFTTLMPNSKLLGLASTRPGGLFNKTKATKFANAYGRAINEGRGMKISPPKLWLDMKDGKAVVAGHEGRHRSDFIGEMFGDRSLNIPVDIEFRGMGRSDLTNAVLDMKLTDQEGHQLDMTLRELLPDGFDTSKLK